jgi:probable rRNA maturation factor
VRSPFCIVITIEANAEGLKAASLQRFIRAAQRSAGLKGSVNVLIAPSAVLRQLNRRFRGKDKPTDVLSFPAVLDAPHRNGSAGDIAISMDIAAENAGRLGHSVEDEIRILLLHGMLHLAGYDHNADDGQMAAREQELRLKLKLPTSLIERTVERSAAARSRGRA